MSSNIRVVGDGIKQTEECLELLDAIKAGIAAAPKGETE